MKKLRKFYCSAYGPKGSNWPTCSSRFEAYSVAEARVTATNIALRAGWPSVRKVEVREVSE